jgi:hypothetical protein
MCSHFDGLAWNSQLENVHMNAGVDMNVLMEDFFESRSPSHQESEILRIYLDIPWLAGKSRCPHMPRYIGACCGSVVPLSRSQIMRVIKLLHTVIDSRHGQYRRIAE